MIKNTMIPQLGLSQNLNISQNTILLLKMIQMNNFQLESYINNEIEENPVLEINNIESSNDESIDWREYFKSQKNYADSIYRTSSDSDSDEDRTEFSDKDEDTFEEHLIKQLYMMDLTENSFKIAVNMIRDLNFKGYLEYSTEELSEIYNIKLNEVEKILEKLKNLEPKGSFARDLSECLLMQIEDLKEEKNYDVLKNIIENNLLDIAEHRYEIILDKYSIGETVLKDIIDKIKSLNPIPSSGFSNNHLEETQYILPEIFLIGDRDSFQIDIPETKYTRLNINEEYLAMLGDDGDDEAKEYIKNSLEKAKMLLKNIESRRNTIKNITEEIVNEQKEFIFDKGILKSLNQSDIAEKLGISASTVSRAIDNKYIDTQRGVFALKFFFSNKQLGNDTEISIDGIKEEIKNIIEKEIAEKPFSDQKIAEILEEKSITISRRTVAKYREELDIPNSSKRKSINKFKAEN